MSWRDRAACRGTDPGLWFTLDPDASYDHPRFDVARTICAGCPVRGACTSWVLQAPLGFIPYGIVAGFTPTERSNIRRGLSRKQVA